jgi:hypothetical protein
VKAGNFFAQHKIVAEQALPASWRSLSSTKSPSSPQAKAERDKQSKAEPKKGKLSRD